VKIGQKVTVVFPAQAWRSWKPPARFLRCYVTRRLPAGWQLYDPIRDYSWGLKDTQSGCRVVVA
jgi:hypothetical protein